MKTTTKFIRNSIYNNSGGRHSDIILLITCICYLQAAFAILNPALGREVRRFGAVISMIITRVIAEWKRDHKLTGLLCYLCKHHKSLMHMHTYH